MVFLFARENRIPDEDTELQRLQSASCQVIRSPFLMWGDFLQFIPPVLVSNYEHIAIQLDDVFVPHQGPSAVHTSRMIENMHLHNIQVMSPVIMGDTYTMQNKARQKGLQGCIGEVSFIETFVQVFSRDAWICYYSMLHYSGRKGWWYDLKFHEACPYMRLALDFSMHAWHMGKSYISIIPSEELHGTNYSQWTKEPLIRENGYYKLSPYDVCKRWEEGCPKIENHRSFL